MAQYDRNYYGNTVDINSAKQSGMQGNFHDISAYGEESKYKDLLHAYKTGANPILLGGAGAKGGINDNIYGRLSSSGANIQRIGGADRYQVKDNFKNYATRLQKEQQVSSIYDQQKKALAPQYAAQSNQADVVSQQNVQRLRELMGAQGLTGSGENVTAQAGANAQRQTALNDVNTQQQQAMNSLEAQRSQAIMGVHQEADEMEYRAGRDKVSDQQWQASFNQQNKQQSLDNAWRANTFNNMSATEKKQLEWAKAQYGEDAAWRLFENQSNNAAATAASQAELEFYKNAGLTP